MSLKSNQSGFSVIEACVVLLVVGLIGFAGFTVYSNQQDKDTTLPTAADNFEKGTSDQQFNSTADLTAAEKTLDTTKVDNTSDSAQLDSQLAAF